jgi:putative ABC transport system substrate-binding protein
VSGIRRREFVILLGGSAAAVWPLAEHAQQPIPVVGFIAGGSPDASARFVAAFRKGLNETGMLPTWL